MTDIIMMSSANEIDQQPSYSTPRYASEFSYAR